MQKNWENYRRWEQLPEYITAPQPPNWLTRLLVRGQCSLANSLVREISVSRKVEHLQRCINLELTSVSKDTQISDFTLIEPMGAAKRSLIRSLYGE
ncbi:hypothetical protein [Myxosarcina sp. GI1]|uniref:hypothetical protein n=1 Tax=Myxosarcina sp. GI1 TaxID=1541065 RepID=UPI0005690EB5|nr:hypothetical protein [Myxosarcina sp. GI1]